MSKKMMKRTAVLSTLIAISLSGTVMASELTIDYANGTYTATGTGIATSVQAQTVADLYTSLGSYDMAGEMKTYASKKPTGIIPGSGLEGGTYTSGPVNGIGQFVSEYSGNKLTVNGGEYVGAYRLNGASTYLGDTNSNANNNEVIVSNVTMTKNGSKYPGVAGGWAWNDANENKITIESSSLSDALVYGGDAQYGDANENIVNVTDSSVGWINGGTTRYDGYDVMGNGKGNANNNTVTITDSTVLKTIKGGSAGGYGNAEGNIVTAENLIFNGDAIDGGFAECGNVIDNQVIIGGADTQIGALVYGGRSQDRGNAVGNSVVINDGTVTNASYGIVGGITENEGTFAQGTEGDALQNSVTITGGTINAKVYGGYSEKGDANENTVNITGGTFSDAAKNIYGGYASVDAIGNIVDVKDVTIESAIRGGVAQTDAKVTGNAEENKVYVENAVIGKSVYGGIVEKDNDADGNAVKNEVTIIDSTIKGAIHGGSISSAEGNASQNKVTLMNTTAESWVTGGHTSYGADANENEVVIGDGSVVSSNVYGGRAQANGSANDNTVTISDATVNGKVYGGSSIDTYLSSWSTITAAEANNNEVILTNATINNDVYGGYNARNTDAYENTVNNNTVTIEGGSVDGNVYGGYVLKGEANDNTVNIGGTAALANASLYGSNQTNGTGNVLNINDGWTGDVKSVQNFNEINISEAAWGETTVTVTDTLALNDTKVTVGTVRVAGDDDSFAPNGSSTVIAAGTITGDISADSSVDVFKGVATIYDASIVKDGNNINIQLAGEETAHFNPQMNPQVLVIGESRTAATAFVNQGTDLIEAGINSLALDEVTADETKVFAALYNGASKYETGSHVKVNGWSGIVGVAKTTDNGLTYGAFFESGEGNYRTYNDIDGMRMRGDGEANYNGGGLLVRKDNANGIYTEASLRAGNLSNRLDGAVMGSDGLTGYDIDSTYYGAHVGIGKIIPKGKDSLDVYGKFLYTHHDSETFEIDGDEFRFDSMDSQRLRLGFRYNSAQTAKVGLYYGAAWEYEFGGDANNTVVGYDLSTPSLEGSTVIGEFGMHYLVSARWSLDANIRGYAGQRDGWSGSVQANYSF